MTTVARFHLLPESYLYGLADVRLLSDYMPTYIFGKVYAHGVWYYFPVSFIVKSTLPFLVLLVITVVAMATRAFNKRREILYMLIPTLIYLAVAMSNGINIGARHVMPVWLLLAVLISGAAVALLQRDRRWVYAIGVLLLAHVITSVQSYPSNYIPYSNALFGGPSNTYKDQRLLVRLLRRRRCRHQLLRNSLQATAHGRHRMVQPRNQCTRSFRRNCADQCWKH
jgi:hypothetical protein